MCLSPVVRANRYLDIYFNETNTCDHKYRSVFHHRSTSLEQADALFFHTWTSIFSCEEAIKSIRPEYISLGKHQRQRQPLFIRPLRLETVVCGTFHFQEASASAAAYCFCDSNLFCWSGATSVRYGMKADR